MIRFAGVDELSEQQHYERQQFVVCVRSGVFGREDAGADVALARLAVADFVVELADGYFKSPRQAAVFLHQDQ